MAEPDGPADGVFALVPAGFGWNAEASASNVFQSAKPPADSLAAARVARGELSGLVRVLREEGVEVCCLEEPEEAPAPDAVFLNNWFSTHADGTLVLYPMATAAPARGASAGAGRAPPPGGGCAGGLRPDRGRAERALSRGNREPGARSLPARGLRGGGSADPPRPGGALVRADGLRALRVRSAAPRRARLSHQRGDGGRS